MPLVIKEENCHPFKFWFNSSVQDGMYYGNELFYRLHTANSSDRALLYFRGCKLAKANSPTIITVAANQCKLWVSLRSPELAASPDDFRLDASSNHTA
ncbi:MAG TPA: hypothetical protein V6C57_23455 [Coleofasciculaceae cyanobacterium]